MQLDRDLFYTLPLMVGYDVRAVQQALIRAGTLNNGGADGVFGPGTREAVMALQHQAKAREPSFSADGIVGRDTWGLLFAHMTATPSAAAVAAPAPIAAIRSADAPADWQRVLRPYAARLAAPHRAPAGSDHIWQLTAEGVLLNGALLRLREDGATAATVWTNFRAPLESCAATYGVPVELLIATICTESGGDPNACRLEPHYVSDEATPGKVSPGLMQTLLSTAAGCMGVKSVTRAQLFVPATSIRAGAILIHQQADRTVLSTNFDPPLVGIAYNAGSLRAEGSNPWGLVQTARPPMWHADVFTSFFNDAFASCAANPPSPMTPCFHTLLQSEGVT